MPERFAVSATATQCVVSTMGSELLQYSLLVSVNVKKTAADSRRRSHTKVSSKHQVTIPAGAFHGAGLEPGDTLKVEAAGAGRIVLTRLDELLDRYSGCLDTGGDLRGRVEGLRGEWR